MFISALGAITGEGNRIGFPRVKSACIIMVDGLGSANLKMRAGHAPSLSKKLNTDGSILCGFPATTATSLSSFATGKSGGQHGMIGYEIFDREHSANLNLLTGFTAPKQARDFQSEITVSEMAEKAGVNCYFVGAPEYQSSGFTAATMPLAKYIAAKTIEERFEAARKILEGKTAALVYLYIPELDGRAHAYGAASQQWLEQLELLESQVNKFVKQVNKQVGIALTADHGITDVSASNQVYLDQFNFQDARHDAELIAVAGDPRVNFLYFSESPGAHLIESLTEWLGKRAFVVTKNQMITSGWYGEVYEAAEERMPDIFIIANGETAIYHRGFAKPHSLKMVGQHGAISTEELTVPLLRFAGFEKIS